MVSNLFFFDVAVIGAGLAGLVCAKKLQQAGLTVVILEKSRGVGGRVATRRLHNTCADHGLPYIEVRGNQTKQLIEQLCERNILQSWTEKLYQLQPQQDLQPIPSNSCYIAPQGMTAIAKYLATDLEIWRECRVNTIESIQEEFWQLTYDRRGTLDRVNAKIVAIAIPAPQALTLLQSSELAPEFLEQLGAVEFSPCIAVIAGYSRKHQQDLPQWQAVKIISDPDLAWVGLDSSKRENSEQPVFVLHSSAQFAQAYLDTNNLQPASEQLLQRAAQLLIPWLDSPDWFTVHRWRYAFPTRPASAPYIVSTKSLPLICCGDWCGGNLVESALISGMASATEIIQRRQV